MDEELPSTSSAELAEAAPVAVTSATGSGDSIDLTTGLLLLGLGMTTGAGLVAAAWALSRLARS